MNSIAFLKSFKLSGVIDEQQKQQNSEEEEDSFIDLELLSVSGEKVQSPKQRPQISTKLGDHITLCSSDSISKRKILPIEPNSKPQSPIQLLKSGPKFPVSIFKKQSSIAKNRAPAGVQQDEENRVLSSRLARDSSTRRFGGVFSPDPCPPSTTRRFSKETMQKYLKMMKPKVLRKPTDRGGDMSAAAADSPAREKQENGLPAGIRLVCKHLGKSKSASAAGGLAATVAPPLNRRDDSLLQQHDGIQSAILHCKRSFNASTGIN